MSSVPDDARSPSFSVCYIVLEAMNTTNFALDGRIVALVKLVLVIKIGGHYLTGRIHSCPSERICIYSHRSYLSCCMLLTHASLQPIRPKLKSYITDSRRKRQPNLLTIETQTWSLRVTVGSPWRRCLLMLVCPSSLLVPEPRFPLEEPPPRPPWKCQVRCPVVLSPRCVHMIPWPSGHSLPGLQVSRMKDT